MHEKWRKHLDKGGKWDVLFIDLSKTFSSLLHDLLLAKLNACGFIYKSIKIISSFLFGRRYRTKINSAYSDWRIYYRSSRPEMFCRKDAFRNLEKFTGKHLCQSLFFNKVAGLRPAALLKKRLWHRCFPVNFSKFLRTLFLQNTSGGCFYY